MCLEKLSRKQTVIFLFNISQELLTDTYTIYMPIRKKTQFISFVNPKIFFLIRIQTSSHTDNINVASLYGVFACDPQDDPLL